MTKITGMNVIKTHLAKDSDPTKTVCGIDMPIKNRASDKTEVALFCTDCLKAGMING